MSYNEFQAKAWAGLCVTERVAQCQFMNNEALTLADNADTNEAAAYRFLARAWMRVADAIGDGALRPKGTERENEAQPDSNATPEPIDSDANIPQSNRTGSDDSHGPPNKALLFEASPTESQFVPENVPLPEPIPIDSNKALEVAIKEFCHASGRQAKIISRLTYAIIFLAALMLFSIGVQIWHC